MAEIDKIVNDLVRKRLEEEREVQHWADQTVAANHAKELRRRFESFVTTEKPKIAPGQMVKWKEGLKNRRRPAYNEPVIVVEVLDDPILEEDRDAGSPYFREHLDVILGVLDTDGDFVCFHFDSRRFESCKIAE